jgi:cephalosporin hydroxylase
VNQVPFNSEQEATRQELITAFHQIYYHHLGWDQNTYLGYQIKQCPFDMQIYQELIFKLKPQNIIQTGVAGGGSLLFFASLLDLIQAPVDAIVIGVDIALSEAVSRLKHPRIMLIEGSSTDIGLFEKIKQIKTKGRCLISLDSDHEASHVMAELQLYSSLLQAGDYLVLEDTNLNGHPVFRNFGPGPYEALEQFLKSNPSLEPNHRLWQKHLFSFHTWLEQKAH